MDFFKYIIWILAGIGVVGALYFLVTYILSLF